MVGADATQAGLVHGVAKLFGGAVIVAGGFDFGVAGGANRLERAIEVLGKKLADAIELKADGQAEGFGVEAIGAENGPNATYDLPSAIGVDNGLTLRTYRGTRAIGYSWTGSVICSRPTSNDFGSGPVHTAGFTFADARVEVQAKMPDLTGGQWPSIWFLPAPGGRGAEIDLFEGGYLADGISPSRLMAVKLFGRGNQQKFVDCGTDLSAAYHTYAMEYRQGSSIRFFFDGSAVCTYTRNVPTGPYFLILSNGIASARTAAWHTQVGDATPAANLMQVSSVRILSI